MATRTLRVASTGVADTKRGTMKHITRHVVWLAIASLAAPAIAQADAAVPETADQCHARCTSQYGEATVGKKAPKKKTAKAGEVVVPAPVATVVVVPPIFDPRTADIIRAEERARAAEEFDAQSEQMKASHDADVEKARAEGADAANEKNAGIRAADRARYDDELATKNQFIQDAIVTPVGVYGFLGGGATNFTQPDAVGATGTGGYWDARLGIGTRSIIGAEVAYVGSSRDIQALGLNSDAFLVGNGVEGIARLNVPITTGNVLIEPYTFGGVGWQRLNIVSSSANTSSFDSEDDIMTVPLGVGFAVGWGGLTLDLRGTYRQALGSNLLGTQTSSFDNTSLNSWGAGGALGFEF
jgi:hypothetical protein